MGFNRRQVQHGVLPCSFNGDERQVRAVAARLVVTWEALQDQGRADRLPARTQASLQTLRESLTGDLFEFGMALAQVFDWVIFLEWRAPDCWWSWMSCAGWRSRRTWTG